MATKAMEDAIREKVVPALVWLTAGTASKPAKMIKSVATMEPAVNVCPHKCNLTVRIRGMLARPVTFVNRNPPIDGRACGFIRVHFQGKQKLCGKSGLKT
jgi:hypothetical protein